MSAREEQALAHWLQGRHPRWKRLESLLERQQGARDRSAREVLELVEGYRSLARDLSVARKALPESRVTRYLESLLARSYDLVHRSPQSLSAQLVQLFRDDLPKEVRNLYGPIAASLAVFAVAILMGWWLVATYPELIALFASQEMIDTVQRGELWTDGLLNVTPSSVLSLSIMTNNIMVTFFAFALGALYGLGTLYILGLNGLMLGAIFAFTGDYGLDGRLFEFVVAHGLVELSIIILAGAAGIRLGEALIRPGQRTRTDAFRQAVQQASRLIAAGVPFLIGAGVIEGFVSPDPQFDLATRVAVGSAYWVLMLLVLSGAAERRWQLSPECAERSEAH